MKTILLPMSKENVLAIMQDRKTMTRRMSKKYANVKKGDIFEIQEALIYSNCRVVYEADGKKINNSWQWKVNRLPSIFMPRRFVRIRCEAMEDVRKERLQDITEEDARKEGASIWCFNPVNIYSREWDEGKRNDSSYRNGFIKLWDSINGKNHPWALNEEVFVLSFKRIAP
jgi:hypothetical protein